LARIEMPRDDVSNAIHNLGLADEFTHDELTRAYRKAALAYHPDKPGGDARKFKIVQKSYEALRPRAQRKRMTLEEARRERLGLDDFGGPVGGGEGKGDINAVFTSVHGNGLETHGHGDWLSGPVDEKERAPERVAMKDLHGTFERIRSQAAGTVSTHVIGEMPAHSTIAHAVYDDSKTFRGDWYSDLREAYSVVATGERA
jgi:DnaJ-class molecular chaperone